MMIGMMAMVVVVMSVPSPICEDFVGHATTMRVTRRGAAFEAPTPSTCCLLATNSKMPMQTVATLEADACAMRDGSGVVYAARGGGGGG
jgi:hypothetical protein